jgi:hypothetical protein
MKAKADKASDPQVALMEELTQLRVQNELLKKTQLAPPPGLHDPPALPTLPAVTNTLEELFKVGSTGKESEKIVVPAMPNTSGYRLWREAVEVATVSASGKASRAPTWIAEVYDKETPLDLQQACEPEWSSLDSKLACALRLVLTGTVGQRISNEVNREPKIKYSGRAILKVFDKEFQHKTKNSLALSLTQLQRLRMKSNDWQGLETFLNTYDSLLIQLEGTPENPSNTFLVNLLEDVVEAGMKEVASDFSLFRQKNPDSINAGSASELINILKVRCELQRVKRDRTSTVPGAVSKLDKPEVTVESLQAELKKANAAVAKAQSVKKNGVDNPAGVTKPGNASTKTEHCRRFAEGRCPHDKDKCKYIHDPKLAPKGEKGEKGQKGAKSGEQPQTKSDKLCHFFPKGECTRGDKCRFVHDGAPKVKGTVAQVRSTPVKVVPPPTVAAPVVLDSGSGVHLRDANNIQPNDQLVQVQPVRLLTAGGEVPSETAIIVPACDVLPQREARTVPGTPDVDSLGLLCLNEGYSLPLADWRLAGPGDACW